MGFRITNQIFPKPSQVGSYYTTPQQLHRSVLLALLSKEEIGNTLPSKRKWLSKVWYIQQWPLMQESYMIYRERFFKIYYVEIIQQPRIKDRIVFIEYSYLSTKKGMYAYIHIHTTYIFIWRENLEHDTPEPVSSGEAGEKDWESSVRNGITFHHLPSVLLTHTVITRALVRIILDLFLSTRWECISSTSFEVRLCGLLWSIKCEQI